ncbi:MULTISPECIES: ECF transporter S component [Streptosporangium]|uniref:Energy-coupling factor transport system substrate-specific component n=1 Tax=Streptosporangium brasiliense TaxID=47480 RepID=A0ABT9R691_9ACTN|nr:ECF transporter S component [Streptosporangium brasiliense]MDP9864761.1 energy-coupling factor transport system substrate-specific component [Streptosporangium brasiliense]
MSTEALSPRHSPWRLNSRTIVFGAVGAALYAVLGLFSFVIPGTQSVAVRPAFALVPFFGKRFGVIAGFFVGCVGNIVIDLIQGAGLLWWNWSVANGLVGALAALIFTVIPPISNETVRHLVTALGALLATAVGLLFVVTDIWLLGVDFETFVFINYLPALLANGIAVVILVPALDAAWEPLAKRAGL